MGRKKIEIDVAEVEKQAGLGLTQEEICANLGISVDTLERRIAEFAEFADILLFGKSVFRKKKYANDKIESSRLALSLIKSGHGYSEKQLSVSIIRIINVISDLLGLPEAIKTKLEFVLPNGVRCDILSTNVDGSVTIYEVKHSSGNSNRGWGLYQSIGQLLYYREVFIDCHECSTVHIVMISDYDPDIYFIKALSNLSIKLHYINVRPLINNAKT